MRSKKLEVALRKVALGYSLKEVTEEYSVEDGEMKLTKRKETRKDVPPDLKAVKLLLEGEEEPVSEWTDEELDKEKARLIALIKEQNQKNEKLDKGEDNG